MAAQPADAQTQTEIMSAELLAKPRVIGSNTSSTVIGFAIAGLFPGSTLSPTIFSYEGSSNRSISQLYGNNLEGTFYLDFDSN